MKILARLALSLFALAVATSPLTATAGNYHGKTKQKTIVITRNSSSMQFNRFKSMNSYNSMYRFNTISPGFISPQFIGSQFMGPQFIGPQFGTIYPYYIYGGSQFHHNMPNYRAKSSFKSYNW